MVAGSPAWPLECPLKDALEVNYVRQFARLGLETREDAQAEIPRDWRPLTRTGSTGSGVNNERPDSLCRHKRGTTLWIVRWVIRVAILPGESPEG